MRIQRGVTLRINPKQESKTGKKRQRGIKRAKLSKVKSR